MSVITPEAAAKHVGALLGKQVTAKKAVPPDLKGPQVLALIHDEANELVCVIHFDYSAAGSTGAGLSGIPAGVVQDCVKKGKMEEVLLENAYEVANVLTVLTTQAVGRRTILRAMIHGKEAADHAAAQAFVAKAKTKIFMQLTVPGYPAGFLGFSL